MAIEESLSTARFVHRVVTGGAAAAMLFVFSPDEARPYREARRELRRLVDLDLEPYYASVQQAAQEVAKRANVEGIVRSVASEFEVSIGEDANIGESLVPSRVVYLPGTIGECATYFERGPSGFVSIPDGAALERALRQEIGNWKESRGHTALKLVDFQLSAGELDATFGVGLTWPDLTPGTSELSYYGELTTESERGLVISGSVPARTVALDVQTPAAWAIGVDPALVGAGTGGPVFPAMRAVWDELRGKGADEAAERLAEREAELRGQITLFELQVPAALTGPAVPIVLAVLLLYLLGHVRHLGLLRAATPGPFTKSARAYPWAALYAGRVWSVLTWCSVLALPGCAAVALVVRSADGAWYGTALGVAGTCAVLAAGVDVGRKIDELRRSIARTEL